MKTIMKTLLVSIVSLPLMFSVNAGELSVSGSAKATYLVSNGVQADNGIGITNELNFTASGEMDNGFTWSYQMELDPADGGEDGLPQEAHEGGQGAPIGVQPAQKGTQRTAADAAAARNSGCGGCSGCTCTHLTELGEQLAAHIAKFGVLAIMCATILAAISLST